MHRASRSVVQMQRYAVFVSHQWLGNGRADPDGAQTKVLQGALRNILDGTVVARPWKTPERIEGF